jgi:hypothetical protein
MTIWPTSKLALMLFSPPNDLKFISVFFFRKEDSIKKVADEFPKIWRNLPRYRLPAPGAN